MKCDFVVTRDASEAPCSLTKITNLRTQPINQIQEAASRNQCAMAILRSFHLAKWSAVTAEVNRVHNKCTHVHAWNTIHIHTYIRTYTSSLTRTHTRTHPVGKGRVSGLGEENMPGQWYLDAAAQPMLEGVAAALGARRAACVVPDSGGGGMAIVGIIFFPGGDSLLRDEELFLTKASYLRSG
jgi:hypothetical protein